MATYLAFSDEAGGYRKTRIPSFHKYFVRSTVLFDSANWISLRNQVAELKRNVGIPTETELKWSYLWSLHKHRINNEPIDAQKPYYFFRSFSETDLIGYIKNVLMLLQQHGDCAVIVTATLNLNTPAISKEEMYKMHLQDLMQRIEMHIQSMNNLAIVFFDQENREVEKLLRDQYSSLYLSGDLIANYGHIKDSICFELSHHSFGIQIADYIAGIFNGMLNDYRDSRELFGECVMPLLRRSQQGELFGYGVIEVPKNDGNRDILRAKLREAAPSIELDDIPMPDADDIPF